MRGLFADTSFYVALLNESDADHSRAATLIEGGAGRVVTTEYVIWELANYLAGTSGRRLFAPFRNKLLKDPGMRIIPASRDLSDDGLAIYVRHQDKEWSLTDCISFAVMRRLRIVDALTADHHFVQAGFRVLLA